MAFPIRFKLIDKKTGKEFKDTDIDGNDVGPVLYTTGRIASIEDNFHTHIHPMSSLDYELHLALEKDNKDDWIYNKVE